LLRCGSNDAALDTDHGVRFDGFFEADAETQSQHNKPIVLSLFIDLEHYGEPGTTHPCRGNVLLRHANTRIPSFVPRNDAKHLSHDSSYTSSHFHTDKDYSCQSSVSRR
jgi:hypothetical protein